MDADGLARWRGAAARCRQWLISWMRGQRSEPLPIRLDRRRIYIVPTRAGFGFALLLMIMFLGSLNYQNNAALLLTCLLGATLASSMLLTWRELHGLTLQSVHAEPGFCGARLKLHLAFADGRHARRGLQVETGALTEACPLSPGHNRANVTLTTAHRGWMPLPRMRLSSVLPFGLFRAWGWITPARDVLVYPRPLHDAAPPVHPDDAQERIAGGDEFAGLRGYHPGDPVRHMAWKASARHQVLLVREFDRAPPGQPLRLDWNDLAGMDRETRISRLTGWVCDAYAAGNPWTLILADRQTMGPDSDAAHYHHCLTALAELP